MVSNFAQPARRGYAIGATPGFCKPTRGWEAAARDTYWAGGVFSGTCPRNRPGSLV